MKNEVTTHYIPEAHTCRICKEIAFGPRSETGMLRYATRHSAHYECFLKAKGAAGIRSLPARQIGKIPYFILKDYGFLQIAEEICRETK